MGVILGGGSPSGTAGGELDGTYPNPTVDDGADATAIHDDVAGEIAAVSSKTPIGGDVLLIEDSEASNAKKSATAQEIADLASVPTHASTTGQTADDHHAQVHDLGGSDHNAATLAQLNAKVSDATLDDSGDSRPPSGTAGGDLGGSYPNPTVDDGADGSAIHDDVAGEIAAIASKGTPVSVDVLVIEDSADSSNKKRATAQSIADLAPAPTHASTTGQTADDHHAQVHDLAGADHNDATLAELNAKVSDATLDDSGDSRSPDGTAGGDLNGTYPNPGVDDGADGSAIHDDVAGEIAAITAKTAAIQADILLIEDSAAANVKKRVLLGDLPYPGDNALINGQFLTAQRGTFFDSTTPAGGPFNSDDTYLLDRWLHLSDGNNIVDVSQETTIVPADAATGLKMIVRTADKKFGIFRILDRNDTELGFDGDTASLSFEARNDGTESIGAVRAMVLAWTLDGAVVSDPVSAWNGAGSNPTLATNWSYADTPAALPALITSFQTFKIEGITIPAAFNVGVFIWVDDVTNSLGDSIYIGNVKLERGLVATPYRPLSEGADLALCQRSYKRVGKGVRAEAFSTTEIRISGTFGIEMRVAPSMSLRLATPVYRQGTTNFTGSGSALSSAATTTRGFQGDLNGFTSLVSGSNGVITDDVIVEFDSEI